MNRVFVASPFLMLVFGCRPIRHPVYTPVNTPPGPVGRIAAASTPVAAAPVPVIVETRPPAVVEPEPVIEPKTFSDWAKDVAAALEDAYFDYDRSFLRTDARTALHRDAGLLTPWFDLFPQAGVVIEGHCDERGSAEYNLALGDLRAQAVKDFLEQRGVPGQRVNTISYGKERPQCEIADESCWQRNRRAHVVVSPKR
jgi:peptidoglycan-associated lipoprotein